MQNKGHFEKLVLKKPSHELSPNIGIIHVFTSVCGSVFCQHLPPIYAECRLPNNDGVSFVKGGGSYMHRILIQVPAKILGSLFDSSHSFSHLYNSKHYLFH